MTIAKAKKCEVINVRVPTYLKEDSKMVLESLELDHSKVFRSLLEYIVKEKKIPTELKIK